MEKLNSFLLSVFTSNQRWGNDVDSLHRRFQSLSLIYINLGLTLLIIAFNLVTVLFFNSPNFNLMYIICLPLSVISFYCLRKQKTDAAAFAILLEMNCANLIASYKMNCPLAGVYAVMIHPYCMFCMTSNIKLHILNGLICGCELYINSMKVLDIFETTVNQEQLREVSSLIGTSGLFLFTAVFVSIIQKKVEANIWNLAKKSHKRSENLTKEVVQAMEAKDAFVSMFSHEIRNPLNALKGSIDYLLLVVKNADYIQVLKNAKMSGDILLNLVNNVLDAAKLKSDKMEIVGIETDFVEVVKKVMTINSDKFKEKKINTQVFIDKNVPRLMWTDSSRILQILMTLISNAVKFTQDGKISVYACWCNEDEDKKRLRELVHISSYPNSFIETDIQPSQYQQEIGGVESPLDSTSDLFEFDSLQESARQRNISSISRSFCKSHNDLSKLSFGCWESKGDGWEINKTSFVQSPQKDDQDSDHNDKVHKKGFLKIQITDTGCGIEESEMSKLFGMFEQTSHGSRSSHGGTGLGLWICKQLCQKMGGDITVYSQFGHGASFVFYISADTYNSHNPRHLLSRKVGRSHNVRAMVVDDYSVNRYLHKLLLEQEGVQVTVACNGLEALEQYKSKAEHNSYDLILMDIQMPEMDGFTAAKKIREWEIEKNLRRVDIYFVTGEYFNEAEALGSFRSQGGDYEGVRCLRKPIAAESIKTIVKQYKRVD